MVKIGFTAGTWDFVHASHVQHFIECKKYCDYLVVGVQIDPSIDRPEKNAPVMSLEERLTMLRANRYVDAVIVYGSEDELMAIEKWLPVDYRFRGKDHEGEEHYETRGEFITIDAGIIHSSDIKKRCLKL